MSDADGSERTAPDADESTAAMEEASDTPGTTEGAEDRATSGEDGERAAGTDTAPKSKKKRKRRKRRDDGAASAARAKDAESDEDAPKPLPGPGTPDGKKLREAHRAFEAGDYALVRKLCRALESSEVPGVPAAAKALYTRTTVDPAQIVVMAACAAVLATIVWVWVIG